MIEKEFGRTLNSIEYDVINKWFDSGISEELMEEALKEAMFSGVTNLRYIDRILFEWSKKGIDNLDKLEKNRKKHIEKKNINVELPDYDWLNSDE